MKTNIVQKEGKAPRVRGIPGGVPGPGRPKGAERRRIHVTLSLEAFEMVEEIAELTNSPKAAILAEMFDEILPAFKNTIDALRVAKDRPREAQRLITNFGAKSVMDLQQASLDLDSAISADEAKTKGKKRRKGRAGDAST